MNIVVISTYNPNFNHLKKMIKNILSSDRELHIIVYDNTEFLDVKKETNHFSDEIFKSHKITILSNGINEGLSIAFNNSINYALNDISENIKGFFFFDQDSTVESSQICGLLDEFALLNIGNVGVFGAQPVDKNGDSYIRQAQMLSESSNYIETDFVISSFSYVPLETINKIGLFDEDLFIDLVDSEYSFRCSANGLLNLVSKKIKFEHCIGVSRHKLLGLRGYSVSSPIRNYYQSRNLILVGRKYGWFKFIATKLSKRFLQVLLSGFHEGNTLERVSFFYRGVKDGVLLKGGKLI
ncbi:glycosyltransferase [Vibrio sp. PNB22_2_2]